MIRFQLRLFGPFQAHVNSQAVTHFRSDKIRALLAYLAVGANIPHRREALATLFWSDYPEETARRNLRLSLSRLRQALTVATSAAPAAATAVSHNNELLTITNHSVQLNIDSGLHWADVIAFDNLLAACAVHPHQDGQRCLACLGRLAVAVDLYEDAFLAGLSLPDAPLFDEWRLLEGEKRHQQAMAALDTLTHYYAGLSSYGRAEQYARRQVALDPLREAAHHQLIHILAAAGQRGRALEQYEACCRILQQQLGVAPEAHTQALYQAILKGEFQARQRRGYSQTGPELPASLTPFIGRQAELEKLAALLLDPAYRLVTLVGQGGMGKTRLATAVAGQIGDYFNDGVWFTALENVGGQPPLPGDDDAAATRRHALATAVAATLNVPLERQSDSARQLIDYLRPLELLLILDNFDHLLPAANLVLEILQDAPRVTILATSRERLNFRAEYSLWVGGLSVPAPGNDASAANFSSVQLFAEHADRAPAGFHLDETNLPDVAEICRLVDGLPLGIELAAAWVDRLTCAEIAAAIRQNLDFLATTMADVRPRHRSIRAVFDSSWCLLTPAQQQLLAQLSGLGADFTAEAAVAATGAARADLQQLADKSLLQATAAGYRMHPLLRQFARQQLTVIHNQ